MTKTCLWRTAPILLLLALCLGLAACDEQPAPPLSIGTNVWPGYEPMYLARDMGWMSPRDGRMVEFEDSPEVMRALRFGAIDAAALTLDEALRLRAEGVPLRVVLTMDESNGADVLLARPGIKTLADLKGKRIGVEVGAVGAYMLRRVLDKAGLSEKAVHIVPLDINAQEQAYRSGKLDAVITFEPTRTHLIAAGAHVLFDSSKIPGEIVDVLVIRPEAEARRHRPQLVRILKAWFHALGYLRAHPEDAAKHMALRLNLTPPEVLAACRLMTFPDLQGNLHLMQENPIPLDNTAKHLSALMLDRGLIAHQPNLAGLVDPGLLASMSR
jgi:NitT/TauT family transport system substrate-binding protein